MSANTQQMQLRWRYSHFSRAILEEQPLCSHLHRQQVTTSRAQGATSHCREQESIQTGVELLEKLKYWCLQDRQGPSWSSFSDLSSKRNQNLPSLSTPFLIPSQCLSESLNQLHYFVWPTVSDLAVIFKCIIGPIIYKFPSHFNYSSPSRYQIVIFILLYIDNIFLHLSSANCITTHPLCVWVIIKNIK